MIKTGTEELDNFLENYKGLTTLYGEGGSGKTTLCMLAAIEQALNNKKVLYLDTETAESYAGFLRKISIPTSIICGEIVPTLQNKRTSNSCGPCD